MNGKGQDTIQSRTPMNKTTGGLCPLDPLKEVKMKRFMR